MNIRFFNIVWDTTTDDGVDDADIKLPTELLVNDVDDDTDLDLEGADILSDVVGFCVENFDFEIVTKDQMVSVLVDSAYDSCMNNESYLRSVLTFYFEQYNDESLLSLYNLTMVDRS